MKSPPQGWADSELSDIFARRLPRVSTSQSTENPKPSGSNSPAQAPKKKKISTIIGSTVGGISLFLIAITFIFYYFKKHQKRRLEAPQEVSHGLDPIVNPWERAELENHPKQELSGTSKTPPELPAESREELSADYHGVEMGHQAPRSWLRFGTPRSPVELPTSHSQDTVGTELSTSGNER